MTYIRRARLTKAEKETVEGSFNRLWKSMPKRLRKGLAKQKWKDDVILTAKIAKARLLYFPPSEYEHNPPITPEMLGFGRKKRKEGSKA